MAGDKKPLFDITEEDMKNLGADINKVLFQSLDKHVLSKCSNSLLRELSRNLSGALGDTLTNCLTGPKEGIIKKTTTEEKPAIASLPEKVVQTTSTQGSHQEEAKFD